ncbi:glycosyltransferase family 4 protein [Pelagicoccus sp. SDUM812003]|uniref:glycosyltransferase family 4 protein n=1 Tax=Pelagicoccus sp. SDUM812003 TaxID=3041267 RepID=UPI00280FBFE0|nr:glycosyltransferase family 4 protein [Pelagicoccus sp. SDUM812003]MDQ8205557.1 glycosyltransferase family 4 protein [Pelagicoccus sp. SDUM812003]
MELSSNAPILILTHEFAPTKGGIATFTEEMARAAVQLGRKVEVWAPRGCEERGDDYPFPVRRLDLKGSQDVSCQIKLVRELIRQRRRVRKAIVYICDPGPVLAMCYLQFFKTFKPGKLILTFHGSEIKTFAANPGKRIAVNQLIKRADRISTPSEFTHGLLKSNFPGAKKKTFLTPGALRSDFEEIESRNARSSKKVHILTVGRLHPRKGQAFIMQALAQLPRQLRRQVSFWIVGTGKKYGYETQLRQMAEQVDFSVTFFGDVTNEQLEDLYARADLFSMTSVNFRKSVEGFGLVYLEAAAHGLPIVAHKVGGVAEAVSDGENGILVEPENLNQLSEAFAQLIQDRELRLRMGRNGKRWARRNNWIQSADLLFNRWDISIDPSLEEPEDALQLVEA